MQINHLTLTNFRAFEQVEFDFQPGMNLIVGINGVGKSSVLDALRVLISQVLGKFSACKTQAQNFSSNDIRIDQNFLTAELKFTAMNIEFDYSLNQDRNSKKSKHLTPNSKLILDPLKTDSKQPLALYFSTRRSLPKMTPPKNSASNQSIAFVRALTHRQLELGEIAQWWLTREELAQEGDEQAKNILKTLKNAAIIFLESCTNLWAVKQQQTTLFLDKDGTTLDVRWLSDGERGILALVLDLAKRLSLANPTLKEPLQEGEAIVLIDELDLHLHPRWQRNIVNKLTTTFPNCQFIATTHSPQIIGEVEPESILIIERGKQPFRPDQSLGMDSNWVLRFLMETSERDINTKQKLERIESLIEDRNFPEATEEIKHLRELGQFPELVHLQTRIERIRRLGR